MKGKGISYWWDFIRKGLIRKAKRNRCSCGKVCKSGAGLVSHVRLHKIRNCPEYFRNNVYHKEGVR